MVTSNRAVEEWLGLLTTRSFATAPSTAAPTPSYQIVIEGESYCQRLSLHCALLEAQDGSD